MISLVPGNAGVAPAEAIQRILVQMQQLKTQASAGEPFALDYIIEKLRSKGGSQGAAQ